MIFQGEFKNSIDPKGRASIPAKFREVLNEVYGDDRLIVTKNLEDGLTANPPSSWKTIVQKVNDDIWGGLAVNSEELARSVGITPKKVLKKGKPSVVLKEVIQEEKADLLVIGHEERTFFEKAFFKGEVEDHARELERETGVVVSIIQ